MGSLITGNRREIFGFQRHQRQVGDVAEADRSEPLGLFARFGAGLQKRHPERPEFLGQRQQHLGEDTGRGSRSACRG